MEKITIVIFLTGVSLASASWSEDTYQPKQDYKTTKQCYQCAYAPPKTITKKKLVTKHEKVYKTDDYGNQHASYEVKNTYVPVTYTQGGGWDKCGSSFTDYEAKQFGIDVWDCEGNCYSRKDNHGNKFRGCYNGQFNIDQNKFGCHQQEGETWCFCYGELCNKENW